MAEGKSFIQLFPSVMGSCFPPTGVKTRKLGFDSDCRGFFGYSNFLGICSKTSRNRSCLQRKLLLRELVGMLARPLSQFCEHGLRHQQLHHIVICAASAFSEMLLYCSCVSRRVILISFFCFIVSSFYRVRGSAPQNFRRPSDKVGRTLCLPTSNGGDKSSRNRESLRLFGDNG